MLSAGKTALFTLFLILAVTLSSCAPKVSENKYRGKNELTTLKKGIPILGHRILHSIPKKKGLGASGTL